MGARSYPELVLAIDAGGTKTRLGLVTCGRDGVEVRESCRFLSADFPDAPALVRAVMATAGEWAARFPVRAVGAATMGVEHEGRVELAPNLKGWEASPINRPLLQRAFPGLPVAVMNDVKAALLAETTWGELRGVRYGAYLNLGTGIALAFSDGGRIYEGAHGMAGEVAYLWEPGDPPLGKGGAPLEGRFGGPAVANLAPDEWEARMERFGWWIGQWLLLLDVERLVLGGGWAGRAAGFLPRWQSEWNWRLPRPGDVRLSRFPDLAALYGAAAAALLTLP